MGFNNVELRELNDTLKQIERTFYSSFQKAFDFTSVLNLLEFVKIFQEIKIEDIYRKM
jgi:hypothetical protein